MSLSDKDRSALVALYWQKSLITFDELESAIESRKWSMAANRMYYSLFHAATALLVHDGHEVASHRGLKGALGLNYVQTGKLTNEEARIFAQLATLRERADYDVIFAATETDIMKYMPRAKALLAKMESFICDQV